MKNLNSKHNILVMSSGSYILLQTEKANQKAKRPRIPNFTFVFTNLAQADQLVER